jgi:hypothetical protein
MTNNVVSSPLGLNLPMTLRYFDPNVSEFIFLHYLMLK